MHNQAEPSAELDSCPAYLSERYNKCSCDTKICHPMMFL